MFKVCTVVVPVLLEKGFRIPPIVVTSRTQSCLNGLRWAGRYHPDKNPTGRERFVAVQRAYERLQAGAAAGQGPRPWRLLLILKV